MIVVGAEIFNESTCVCNDINDISLAYISSIE